MMKLTLNMRTVLTFKLCCKFQKLSSVPQSEQSSLGKTICGCAALQMRQALLGSQMVSHSKNKSPAEGLLLVNFINVRVVAPTFKTLLSSSYTLGRFKRSLKYL